MSETSDPTPDYTAVRGAADWVLYWYGDPAHQGEEDQTSAALWALGDELGHQLIAMTSELAEFRARRTLGGPTRPTDLEWAKANWPRTRPRDWPTRWWRPRTARPTRPRPLCAEPGAPTSRRTDR